MLLSKSKIAPLVVAVVLGLALGGGAVAAVTIPAHSVGWNDLSRGVQRRIEKHQPPGFNAIGPAGPAGPPGPQGAPGVNYEAAK